MDYTTVLYIWIPDMYCYCVWYYDKKKMLYPPSLYGCKNLIHKMKERFKAHSV